MMNRQSWDTYFFNILNQVSNRSTCLRRHIAALAVRDNRILATGYNGPPSGIDHCIECYREKNNIPSGQQHEVCMALHAEQNVIIQAATSGVNLKGCDFYISTQPCFICAKMLVNCHPRKIMYIDEYPDELSVKLLTDKAYKSYLNLEYLKITQWEF